MAERRMFSKRIISSDAFMDMSASAQMLYFHLSMWADDEGFVNNPKTIQRMCGADSEDMSALIKNGLVIRFESGIIAIKHWKTHNYIRGDRIKPTYCADEKAQLCVSEDGVYSFAEQNSENAGEPEREYEADSSAQSENSARNGSVTVADTSAQSESSARNGSGTVADTSAQPESSAQNDSGTVADNSAQAKDSTRNDNGAGADSALNGNGAGAESSTQAKDSTINGNGAGAESSAHNGNGTGADSAQNGSETVADSSAQAKDSTRNDIGAGAESSAQAKYSTRNGNGAGADNSAQAKDSTRKGEKCDKEALIEKYGIVNVLQYEDRFKKWAEKRGRQGMPLYPTISAWMEQDKVVNRREHSSIPDYYLSDDFLLEGF